VIEMMFGLTAGLFGAYVVYAELRDRERQLQIGKLAESVDTDIAATNRAVADMAKDMQKLGTGQALLLTRLSGVDARSQITARRVFADRTVVQ